MFFIKDKLEKKITNQVLLRFLIANFIFSITIASVYIFNTKIIVNLLSVFYISISLISSLSLFYILIYGFNYLGLTLFNNRKFLYFFSIPIVFLFQIFLFTDIAIYRIFKFHFNGMAWNLMTTEGATDSVHIGFFTYFTVGFIISGLIAGEIFLIRFFIKNQQKSKSQTLKVARIFLLLLIFIIADKAIYATADALNNISVLRYSRMFPLYQPLTVKKILIKHFGFNPDDYANIKLAGSESVLNYPLSPILWSDSIKKPNMVWIIIDACRYDMLNNEITPEISKFAKKSLVFNNHRSGGNATRFGVFSMFYGIYGSYWHQFLSESKSPVFIDELMKQGYDFKILASTKLTFPEFRQTAFVNIPTFIEDEITGDGAKERDPKLVSKFGNWIEKRDTSKPFFSFILFDGPHGPYSYPAQFEKFKPAQQNANYVTVNEKSVDVLKNAYKNDIYFDDNLTGKIIKTLENNNLLNNTIVVITADHGEEFFEHGYFGHTSSFTKEQTAPIFVMYVPGKQHQEINQLTSHLDLVPTMFELMGCKTSPEEYSLGQSLFAKQENKYVVSSGWDQSSIIDNDNSIVFSTETYNMSLFEFRDKNYDLITNESQIPSFKKNYIKDVAVKFSRFLK